MRRTGSARACGRAGGRASGVNVLDPGTTLAAAQLHFAKDLAGPQKGNTIGKCRTCGKISLVYRSGGGGRRRRCFIPAGIQSERTKCGNFFPFDE